MSLLDLLAKYRLVGGKCGDCKHWTMNSGGLLMVPALGVCGVVDYGTMRAVGGGKVETGETFGCVKWEAKA